VLLRDIKLQGVSTDESSEVHFALTNSSRIRRVKSWGFNQFDSQVVDEVPLVAFPEGAILRFLVDVACEMVSVAIFRQSHCSDIKIGFTAAKSIVLEGRLGVRYDSKNNAMTRTRRERRIPEPDSPSHHG
jgi:hypothetical protein